MNGFAADRAALTRWKLSLLTASIASATLLAFSSGSAQAASPLSVSDLLAPTDVVTISDLLVDPALRSRGGQLRSAHGLSEVTISRDLDSGFSVSTGGETVRIDPLEVSSGARPARLRNGAAALFGDAARDTDVIVRPTATGVESFQVLGGPAATRSFCWRISLAPGQRLVALADGGIALVDYSFRKAAKAPGSIHSAHVPPASLAIPAPTPAEGVGIFSILNPSSLLPPAISGALKPVPATVTELTDAGAQLAGSYDAVNAAEETFPNGRVVGIFAAPWAVDADGREVGATLGATGDVVTLELRPGRGASYPVIADPAYSSGLATKAAAAGNAVPESWERGTNLVTFLKDGYRDADNRSRNALTALRSQQGVGTVVLTPTDYVTSADPSTIVENWKSGGVTKNESDSSIREASCAARLGGVKRRYGGPGDYQVALKPHIDMTDGSFRGYIDPEGGNLDSFWSRYRALMLNQARLAIQIGAGTLVVGTELTALSDDPADEARWRALISEIRGVSAQRYECMRPGREQARGPAVSFAEARIRLTYAANWDAIDRIGFWDALDMIGADYYESGTNMSSIYSTVAAVEAKLQSSGAGMRPFLFTEIGYDGLSDPAGFNAGSPDANQAAMYGNSFSAWLSAYDSGVAPWFDGFWWWDRYAQGGGKGTPTVRDDFTPGTQGMATQCAYQCPTSLIAAG